MNNSSINMKFLNIINRSIILGSVFLIFSCQKKIEKIKEQTQEDPILSAELQKRKALSEATLLSYLKAAKTVKPNPANGIPFNKLDYDKIIAYDFQGDEEASPQVIDKNGKFIPIIEKQQFLTQLQADKILSALTKKSSYGEASAACFNPNLGLVLFKDNKKVNQISICLSCNDSTSEIDIPARRHNVFNKGTDHEYSFTGFTPKGKAAVVALCKELKFSYAPLRLRK
jgi:hypothetical protein